MDRYEAKPLPLPPTLPFGDDADAPRRCSLLQHLRDRGPADPRLAARLLAMHDIGKWLQYRGPLLERRREQLIRAHGEARRALARLGSLAREGRLAAARHAVGRVNAEHAADGAEDRRRRPWPVWVAWAVIGFAAAFETWFFGQILSFVGNLDTASMAGRIFAVVAYIPGALLAMALVVTGTQLGEALARRKHAKEGRPTANPKPVWELAIPLTLLLVAAVVALSWARARFLDRGPDVEVSSLVPEWSVILLLTLVTVTSIVVKAVTHNPYADRAEQVERELDDAAGEYLKLRDDADGELDRLKAAWHALQDAYLTARDEVHNVAVVLHWAFPPDRDVRSGPAVGDVLPGPPGSSPNGWAEPAFPPANQLLTWLEHLPSPQPALGPLWQAEQILTTYAPGPLDARLDELTDQLDRQLARGPS